MRLANPIYDVVFKYLMNDAASAKLLLSRIIEEEVESLELRPTETQAKISLGDGSITVLRLDFAARVRTQDGSSRLVLIEIQKAAYPEDIMRFRKYLGSQYQSEENVARDDGGRPLPIITIYFLGYSLPRLRAPVLRIRRSCVDAATGEVLDGREDFVECLTHDSHIIQIPELKARRRNRLETLLAVFDQDCRAPGARHFINLQEDEFPEEFRPVVRRLQKAAVEADVCRAMDVEDEIVNHLKKMERSLGDMERSLEEKEKELEEKQKAIAQSQKEIQKKDEAIQKALNALIQRGMTPDEARRILGIH